MLVNATFRSALAVERTQQACQRWSDQEKQLQQGRRKRAWDVAEHCRQGASARLTLIECIGARLARVAISLGTAQLAEVQLIPGAITIQAAAIWKVFGDPANWQKHQTFWSKTPDLSQVEDV